MAWVNFSLCLFSLRTLVNIIFLYIHSFVEVLGCECLVTFSFQSVRHDGKIMLESRNFFEETENRQGQD